MSKNRENVTWQSEDGTWNIGFWDYYETGDPWDDDFDDEWDVEYTGHFGWVSVGNATPEAARETWRGCNPGGTTIYQWGEANRTHIEQFDSLAARFFECGGVNSRVSDRNYFS